MQIKYLYAEHVYGWGAETLGYYISFLSGIRAVHLLFILPRAFVPSLPHFFRLILTKPHVFLSDSTSRHHGIQTHH